MCRNKLIFKLFYLLGLILTFLMTGALGNRAFSQQINPDFFKSLKYRHIGPVGNRVIAVVGVPGDRSTCYIGAASGGIFKTTNGGISWRPVFDKQQVSSVCLQTFRHS